VSAAETGPTEWEKHSRDEEHAIRKQQTAAGPSHEPVGESIPDRVQASADSAADVERQRCAAAVQRWLEPCAIIALTGPLPGEAVIAVQSVLLAVAQEIRETPL
jgi:hypothetical protein